MSAREALIFDVNGGMSVSEAAREHGVARSCAYKWVGRYRQLGEAGLMERSRRPEFSPQRVSQQVVDELLELKAKHGSYGPAKLAAMLRERHGQPVLAASTAGEILLRHGLVQKRRPRQRSVGPIERFPYQVAGAGDSMSADYKGQFRMRNGRLCYPLTIADPFSRYVLAIDAMPSPQMEPAKTSFERVFRRYGLPRQIITDNGTPFCNATSLGGLTQLSRWWIELGITPVRIAPGRPQQNAIHERMHRTLKEWIARNPKENLPTQQRSFDTFRQDFNEVRPHQSLGQKTPCTALGDYRPFSTRPRAFVYDTNMEVRSVNTNGEIKWNGTKIFLSQVLVGANIGLLRIADAICSIYLGSVRIGYMDEIDRRALNRHPGTEHQDDK